MYDPLSYPDCGRARLDRFHRSKRSSLQQIAQLASAMAVLTPLLCASPALAANPGTHTWFYFEQSGLPDSFYNLDIYATWSTAPASGYIYPAMQFWFQQGQGGYFGTQLVGSTKKAIFSIWDTTDGTHTALPIASTCQRFGDDVDVEGTGAQCLIDYPWVAGREYRIRIWELQKVSGGEQWLSAVEDTTTGIETQIGVIQLQNSGGYIGYGWLQKTALTFLEYFGGVSGCNGQPLSNIKWRGPYANDNSWTASNATVGTYGCTTHNDVTTTGQPASFNAVGDSVSLTNPEGTTLWPTGCE